MHQRLRDVAVDVLTDLTDTSQLKEAASDDTSNTFTECELCMYEHTQPGHVQEWRRPDGVTSN